MKNLLLSSIKGGVLKDTWKYLIYCQPKEAATKSAEIPQVLHSRFPDPPAFCPFHRRFASAEGSLHSRGKSADLKR